MLLVCALQEMAPKSKQTKPQAKEEVKKAADSKKRKAEERPTEPQQPAKEQKVEAKKAAASSAAAGPKAGAAKGTVAAATSAAPAAKVAQAPAAVEKEKKLVEKVDQKGKAAEAAAPSAAATVERKTPAQESAATSDKAAGAAATAEKGESEQDAPSDSRQVIKEKLSFLAVDTTLNVVPALEDTILMALNDGGLQHLIAGARANVGLKAGRYMFEVRICEVLNPAESGGRGRPPMPKQLLRLGFSTRGSSLVLGDESSEEHVGFDSEGHTFAGKKRLSASSLQRFRRDQVVAVVLNLDPKSPNHNTVSLFREGERITEPQPLPEALHGKTLYPHLAFRNLTVQVLSAESQPTKPLPFKCRTVQNAAVADTEVSKPHKGQHTVLFPVAFPNEGTFDWLDAFLAENPHFVELSERKILEWAHSSGLWKNRPTLSKNSNDRPDFNFGIPGMDDHSVRRIINNIAPVVPRDYIVMEVKKNLIASDRKEILRRFGAAHYKKVAKVVMGDPSEGFKKIQQEQLLKEKQEKLEAVWRQKKAETERKRHMEDRQKQMQQAKRRREEQRAKEEEEAAAAKKKKEDEEAGSKEEVAEKPKEEGKEAEEGKTEAETETKKTEEKEDGKKEGKDADSKMEGGEEEEKEKKEAEARAKEDEELATPPKAVLTEEERALRFQPKPVEDLTAQAVNTSFGSFSIPEKDEGFDEIVFEWQDEGKSKEYLQTWVLERKRTSRVDDIEPSAAFHEKLKQWQATMVEFRTRLEAGKKPTGGDEGKEAETKGKGEENDEKEVDLGPNDIFAVEDVSNVGNGEPLFKHFTFEDWALVQLRSELFLLVWSFAKDVKDPDRAGIPEQHLGYYYSKYFKKQMLPKHFGMSTLPEMVAFAKDTVSWSDKQVLTTQLNDDVGLDYLVKLAEEQRRQRQRRIDAGDETARLKLNHMAFAHTQAAKPVAQPGSAGRGGGGSSSTVAPRPVGQVTTSTWAAGGSKEGAAGGRQGQPQGQPQGQLLQPGQQQQQWSGSSSAYSGGYNKTSGGGVGSAAGGRKPGSGGSSGGGREASWGGRRW